LVMVASLLLVPYFWVRASDGFVVFCIVCLSKFLC
jgi:hypothetical protein